MDSYSVCKNKELLLLVQNLYQQKLISREDKNEITKRMIESFQTKSYQELKKTLESLSFTTSTQKEEALQKELEEIIERE